MMRKLTGKGERVREKMIETTVHILQQQGFKKATVRSIAKAAGAISPPCATTSAPRKSSSVRHSST